jgi:UDP-N-acetylglucosamine:LPS N-acetylglucosamine transferase
MPSKAELRKRLGYGSDPLIICTIGGTGVGKPLLDLCSRTYVHLTETIPNLQMVLVCGPHLDASSITPTKGIQVRGYVPDLYEHYAASDLVITQGGGNTTIELTALKVPFIYFPLEEHREQQMHVSKRVERHRAGVRMAFSGTDPQSLADTVLQNIGKPVDSMDIDTEGARRAAEFLCSLL